MDEANPLDAAAGASQMIPAWIDPELWAAYLEMRKKIKKPMTDYAQKLAIRMLEKMRMEGQDITAVIEQSIFNSWQGLFPVKNTEKQAQGATEAWSTLRECIRANKEPPAAIKAACSAIGGFWRLCEMDSKAIDFKQRDFEQAYRQGSH